MKFSGKTVLIGVGALVFVLLLGMLILLISGAFKQDPSTQPMTLTVWGLEDQALYKRTFDTFTKNHPNVKIIYRQQSIKGYVTRLKERKESTQEGDKPDVFLFHNTWRKVPNVAELLVAAPADIMAPDTFEKTYYKVATETLLNDKKTAVLGLPESVDTLALYYNPELFRAKNLEPPPDWERFYDDALKLTAKTPEGQIDIAGAAIGTADNITYANDIISLMFAQQATNLVDIDTENGESIFEYYARFAKGNERVWDASLDNDIDMFARGKVAMIFAPARAIGTIRNKNPNLSFRIAPVPQLRPEDSDKRTLATFWSWGVSNRTKSVALSWELASSLASKAALSRANSMRQTLTKDILPYPQPDMAKLQANEPLMAAFLSQALQAVTAPPVSQVGDDGLNDQLGKIVSGVIKDLNTSTGVNDSSRLKQSIAKIFDTNYSAK